MTNYFSYFNILLFVVVTCEALVLFATVENSTSKIRGGDASFYIQTAESLSENGTYSCSEPYCYSVENESTMLKPPGYSLFLAGIYRIFGESVVLPLIVQFFLIFLTGIGIKQLARYHVGEIESQIAGLITVIYLPLLSLSLYHLSEVLACCLVVWSTLFVKKWTAGALTNSLRKSIYYSILTGAVFGFTILVRANWALFILPIIAVPFLLIKNREILIKSALTLIISFGLVLLPWTIRNYVLSGSYSLSSVSGMSLYQSALQYSGKISPALTIADWEFFLAEASQITRGVKEKNPNKLAVQRELIENEVYKQRAAAEFSTIDVFNDILKRLPIRIVYFWSVADLSLESSAFHRLAQLQYIGLFIFFIIGLIVRRKDLFQDWLLWTPALYITVIHLIFHVEPRYSLPSRMALSIYCAVGIISLWKKLQIFIETERNVSKV